MTHHSQANDKTTTTTRPHAFFGPARSAAAKKRPAWTAKETSLSREETRRIVIEMIG